MEVVGFGGSSSRIRKSGNSDGLNPGVTCVAESVQKEWYARPRR